MERFRCNSTRLNEVPFSSVISFSLKCLRVERLMTTFTSDIPHFLFLSLFFLPGRTGGLRGRVGRTGVGRAGSGCTPKMQYTK